MKQKLLKTMLLLSALVVGSGSVWATEVITYTFTGASWTATVGGSSANWTSGKDGAGFGNNGIQVTTGATGANGTSPASFSNISEIVLTYNTNKTAGAGSADVQIGTNEKVSKDWAYSGSSDGRSANFTLTYSYATPQTGNVKITLNTTTNSIYLVSCKITYTSSGPVTYSVTYNGNGAKSGTPPTDATAYTSGDIVTVLGNTGSLKKTSFEFDGWNTKADGTGTDYDADDTFTITANTTLYAKWNFVVEDGVFDFVNAVSAGEDYGSGVTTTSSSSVYITDDKTWTAGNVTMVTSRVSGNGYRWWSDGTLRFYNKSSATFSVPDGYVITKIVTTGANFDSASDGTLSGTTWTGASNEVALSATATRNIKTITVTYTTENQSVTITDATGYATYCSPYALNFTGKEIKAYIAKGKADYSGVTFEQVYKVPANTGVLLYKSGGTTENIPVFDGKGADDTTDNVFIPGTGEAVASVDAGDDNLHNYILNKVGGVVGFYKAAGQTVATNRAYIQIDESESYSVKEFIALPGFEDDADGIQTLSDSPLKGENIYNLAGQRLQKMQKGINIVNGKKVLF